MKSHPVEMSSHCRMSYCYIQVLQEELLQCVGHDPRFHLQKWLEENTLGTCVQLHHNLLRKLSSPNNCTFFVGFGTVGRPSSIVMNIVDSINVKEFLIRRENFHSLLFIEIRSNPIRGFFSLRLVHISEERFNRFFLYG